MVLLANDSEGTACHDIPTHKERAANAALFLFVTEIGSYAWTGSCNVATEMRYQARAI